MDEERTHSEIELRSEEVQEVMGRIPPAILRYGIVVLLGIMVVVLAGSACFSYPDTVETEFALTTQPPPAYIMAHSAGRIEQLYTANGQAAGKGDILGVIENVAQTEDLFELRERMKEWKQGGSRTEQVGTLFFHRIPELGSVQAAYSSCLLAWNNYLQHMQESRTYETEVANTVAGLFNALGEWEKSYLLTAPVEGTVAFMQLWKRNQNVEAGETMFVIV
ncbi:HlyD family secretion protein, partial [uncultured Phocaeicola sp.]|uniref:HlyD family secretion protein n=1 Tax=uncultured Phocaeicola sp. TaxID=990718 RepID=UPI0025A968FA